MESFKQHQARVRASTKKVNSGKFHIVLKHTARVRGEQESMWRCR